MLAWIVLSALVLNEICYDPPGADGGAEFVELWNPGMAPVSLAGVRLEFANGADDPPDWSVRWTGDDHHSIPAGGVFLIVDRHWTGDVLGQSEASLGLQNGPDALRLTDGTEVLDLVGWGELAWPELSEGDPAEDVTGLSLARRPDGHDTDDNLADLRGAEPTPGTANWQDVAPELAEVIWSPPSSPFAGDTVSVILELANRGLQPLPATSLGLVRLDEGWWSNIPAVAPDGGVRIEIGLTPRRPGLEPVLARLVVAPTETVDLAAGWFQVGLPALRLSEVMAAPDDGGEWCEIINTGSLPRSLDGLQLRDEDGSWRGLPAAELAPGECRLVAQDADGLAAWLDVLQAAGEQACTPLPVLPMPSWPSLNNSAPASRGFADRLVLGDDQGRVIDHATVGLGTGEALPGRSLERSPLGRWRAATAVARATPGCPPFAPPTAADQVMSVQPNPFSPHAGPGATSALFTVPSSAMGWELRVFDLWGQLVRDLGGDELGPGPRNVVWDGRDGQGRPVAPGGYVVVLHWRGPGAQVQAADRRLVAVEGEAP